MEGEFDSVSRYNPTSSLLYFHWVMNDGWQFVSFDVYVQTYLLDLYGSCESIVDASNVFDKMLERDVVAWNATLVGYTRLRLVEIAIKLLYEMSVRNVFLGQSWLVFMSKLRISWKLWKFFEEMQNDGARAYKMTIMNL